jgi:hypothetical protein
MTRKPPILSSSEIDFLDKYNISSELVLNAVGMKKAEYAPLMKKSGLLLASGVTPCAKAGHTLRTSAGHCAQCDPNTVLFSRRHMSTGIIYIAFSEVKKIIKVGVAETSAGQREESLQKTGYGGINDWKIIYAFAISDSGRLENEVHRILNDYNIRLPYFKDGKNILSKELFSCTSTDARKAVKKAALENKISIKEITVSSASNPKKSNHNYSLMIDSIIDWYDQTSTPDFNISFIEGMKKLLNSGGQLSEKQAAAVENIAKKWKIV